MWVITTIGLLLLAGWVYSSQDAIFLILFCEKATVERLSKEEAQWWNQKTLTVVEYVPKLSFFNVEKIEVILGDEKRIVGQVIHYTLDLSSYWLDPSIPIDVWDKTYVTTEEEKGPSGELERMTVIRWGDFAGYDHGKHISFYPNGKREAERNYKFGRADGLITIWDEEGNIQYQEMNENGVTVWSKMKPPWWPVE